MTGQNHLTERLTVVSAMVAVIIGMRLLYDVVGYSCAQPFIAITNRLPDSDGGLLQRLGQPLSRVTAHIDEWTPKWVEHHGYGVYKLNLKQWGASAERLLSTIPSRYLKWWSRASVFTMTVLVFMWSIALIASLARLFYLVITSVDDLAVAILSIEPPQGDTTGPSFDLAAIVTTVLESAPELLSLAIDLAISVSLAILVWQVVALVLLPSMAIHEAGHYLALRDNGASVDGYGPLLIGPVIAGAFVEPGDDAEDLTASEDLQVASAGIMNTLIYGTVLLAVGLLLTPDPLAILVGGADTAGIATQNVVGYALITLALFEGVNAIANAFPYGPVDGGLFVKALEKRWYGEDKPQTPVGKIRHVMQPDTPIVHGESDD